ncbi:FAD-dependent oxidoreductase [Kineococcus rubinsiae]|uniref:FAD-dependent oxidoreductase n=1 Tax=Kineococcus rubinsiae TaxID=2609562 RepID=UPI0014322B98|nr:FAD-dependent oxidoreductase [Kineococcus rubinsiae]NIZ89674.1 FAD-dependent oxidoreductase [Kineococcus rubinsiae]
MTSTRHVVVGAGLAGSAAAHSLARRGHEVTVLERTRPAAPDGSSHGSARIFRYAYRDRFWTDLVVRAKDGFDELERLSGRRLVTPTGSLDHGATRDPVALAAVLAACGVEHELLGRAAAQQRWPGIAVETDVLWHPGAGVVDAESTVTAQLELAARHGAQVLPGWDVERVVATATGYRLTSTDGRVLDAERVVVAAGGWLPGLLGRLPLPAGFLDRVPPLRVTQEQTFHFPYREPVADGRGWPTTIHGDDGVDHYTLPGGRDAGFRGQKVAEFAAGRPLRSAAAQDGVVDPANRARVTAHVERYLPGLVPEPYAESTCLFTSTPTEDFLIDRVDGITLLSPCSGHGAKFAPVLGELAADVVTGSGGPARFTVAGLAAAGAASRSAPSSA